MTADTLRLYKNHRAGKDQAWPDLAGGASQDGRQALCVHRGSSDDGAGSGVTTLPAIPPRVSFGTIEFLRQLVFFSAIGHIGFFPFPYNPFCGHLKQCDVPFVN